MQLNEKLYQAYLEELQALEDFRSSYGQLYGGIFQELAEDPFTNRLTEALAFFTARQKLLAEKQLIEFYQRLFRQYFSFLATPLPTAGLVQIFHPLSCSDRISISQGSEIIMNTSDGRQAYFQTLLPLETLPIQLHKFQKNTTQFTLEFRSSFARHDQMGEMRFYVNHLGHFPSSMGLTNALYQFLEKIEIRYGPSEENQTFSLPCSFSFENSSCEKVFSHPIEALRFQMHFPEQELFLTIKIPPCSGKWQKFTLHFFIKDNWPKELQISKDSLLPFVVPIANLKRCFADSICCDGTKDLYPILYPYPDDQFCLHSLLGVWEIAKNKMNPILPGIFLEEKGRYEIHSTQTKQMGIENALSLDFADSLINPKLIGVEGLWFQPWINAYLDKEIKFKIVQNRLSILDVHILGKMCPGELSLNYFDIHFLTQILALKNQTSFDKNSFFFLANAAKCLEKSHFHEIQKIVDTMTIYQEPHPNSFNCFSSSFHFFLEKWDGKNPELILLFFKYMKKFLNSWLSNSQVEFKLSSSKLKTTLQVEEKIFS